METEEHRKSFDDFIPASTPNIKSCLSIDRLLKDLGSWKPRLLAADPVTPGKDGLLTFFQDVLLLVKKLLNLCESPEFLGLIRFLDRFLSVVFPRIHIFWETTSDWRFPEDATGAPAVITCGPCSLWLAQPEKGSCHFWSWWRLGTWWDCLA